MVLHEAWNLLIEDYLAYCRIRGLAPSTCEIYRGQIRRFATWCFANGIEPRELSRRHAVRFFDAHLSSVSAGSRRGYHGTLRGFFNWLIEENVLVKNPLHGVPAPRIPDYQPHPLEIWEIQRMLAQPTETPDARQTRLLVEVLYGAGLRAAEATGIRLSDLALSKNRLSVLGKGRRRAEVEIPAELARAIARFLERDRPRLAPRCDALFINARGTSLKPKGLRRRIDLLARQAGVQERRRIHGEGERNAVTPHAFRHSFGSHIYEKTRDLLTLKEGLRHSSIKSTQVYARVTAAMLRGQLAEHPIRAMLDREEKDDSEAPQPETDQGACCSGGKRPPTLAGDRGAGRERKKPAGTPLRCAFTLSVFCLQNPKTPSQILADRLL